MSKTKIIFISNLVPLLIYLILCLLYINRRDYVFFTFFLPPIFLVIFNILAGIIIFLAGKQELGNAFVLVGLVSLLIGGSFCGLLAIAK